MLFRSLVGSEAALEKLLPVLVRAAEVLHRPAQCLFSRLCLGFRYVGIGLGRGQVLLSLRQILQANSKLFALGLELSDAAIPLTPQSVNGMGLALDLLAGRLKFGLRGG